MSDWLSSAVEAVGNRRTEREQEAAATYLAMRKQQDAAEAEELRRVQRDIRLIGQRPKMHDWVARPENARSAHGDVPNLAAASSWFGRSDGVNLDPGYGVVDSLTPRADPLSRRRNAEEIIEGAAIRSAGERRRVQAVEENRPASTPWTWFRGMSVDVAEGLRQTMIGSKMYIADAVGADLSLEGYREDFRRSQERQRAYRPDDMGMWSEAIFGGVSSLAQIAPALAAAPFTGGASAVGLLGLQTGTRSYGKYRTRGGTAKEALLGGVAEGAIEVATEIAPMGFLVSQFGKRGAAGFVGGFLGREMLTEQIATLGQDAVDTAIANPTATWDQYWADRPRAAFDTAVATVIATGGIGAASGLVSNIRAGARDLDNATAATAEAAFLDQAIALGEQSKVRRENPEAFRSFIEQQAAGSGVENVYVPAEAVRSLFQSESIDPRTDPFWAPFADQYAQAVEIGGDVIIPVADAVAGFSGNGQWETLRDSVRLSPGGISLAEARSISQSYQDLMIERGENAARSVAAAVEELAPVRRVYDSVLQQARTAGMSLSASRAYADLFAARYEARAQQRGVDAFTLFEQSLGGIVGEAPEAVRRYEALDQVDQLVAVMRRGKAGPSDRQRLGASLLEFVASRGGVEDPGGDLASMGLDRWHNEAPFRKRLVRKSEAAGQGSMLGGGGSTANTLDTTALDAWEAGYFPEFTERPSVADLIEAMGEEMRGTPRYSETSGADATEADAALRSAAEDLRAFLDVQGIDPDTAPVAEIRAAIDAHSAVAARGFDQTNEFRRWDEPPPGMSDIVLHHNGPANLPRGRPTGRVANYFGTRDFNETVGLDFGPWRYTYWVPQELADAIVQVDQNNEAGRKFAGAVARRQFPDEPEYAEGLESGDPDAWLDFYETWADSSNIAPLLAELGYAGARHRNETILPPESVAKLVDRRSGPDDGTLSFYQSQPEHPAFYSALLRAVEGAKTAKAPAAQWLATLRNAPGVKAEELEWSGLLEWMEEQPGSISRTDIESFLREGGIRVDEVVLGDFDPQAVRRLTEQLIDAEVAKRAAAIVDEDFDPWDADADASVPAIEEVLNDEETEVIAWSFDGIEYDSEDAATDARVEAVGDAIAAAETEALLNASDQARRGIDEEAFEEEAKEELGAITQYADYTLSGEATPTYRELLLTLPLGQGSNPKKAPPDTHWDQPGVVAHVRFQKAVDSAGRPVLFVEEVQSDWHQKGRDQGYSQAVRPEDLVKAGDAWDASKQALLDAQWAICNIAIDLGLMWRGGINDAYENSPFEDRFHGAQYALRELGRHGDLTPEVQARYDEAQANLRAASLREGEARQAYGNASRAQGIPDAPFRTSWPTLVMKRVIRWAVDNGYSSVAWTTGEQQANRYGLEFNLGEAAIRREEGRFIVVPKDSIIEDLLLDRDNLEAYGDNDSRGIWMDEAQIRKVFGAALGDRLIATADDPAAIDKSVSHPGHPFGGTWAVLRGGDLHFGGEGMRAFYDRNLVNITNDLIKRYGSKVRKMPVALEGDRDERLAKVARHRADAAYNYRVGEERLAEEGFAAANRIEAAIMQWGFDITPKMAEAAQRGFSLFQGGEDKPRARIDFDRDNRAVIRLFENRDLSSLLHEGSHLWLEELKADANLVEAPEQVREDWNTIRAWFRAHGHRVGPNGAIPVEAHEMFARAGERYFMEGKAPSSALQRAFSSFRAWLLRIYQVVQRLDAPLTDEVRGVLDRMFASQEAIADAAASEENALLFKSATDAGMTDAEFETYRRSAQATRSEAFDALLYRTMETIRRERTAEWKAQRKGVRAEIVEQVRNQPEFRALALLRGRGAARTPLNRAAFVAQFGTDALALMPRGVPPTIVEDGGVEPEVLAELSGFRTAQEMVDLLMGVEQRQRELREAGAHHSVFHETVEMLTDTAMRERVGDPLSDGSIEEAALEAIHNDQRAEVIASEVRALSRKSRRAGDQVPTPWRVAKEWAERVVREGKVSEQASGAALARHRRNEGKAARAAEAALLAGNAEEAYRQKQSQLYHHALFRAARDAKDQVDAIVKRLDRYAKAKKLPTMAPDYLDRIHELLETYDFKRRSMRDRAERQSFVAWAAAREAEGEEVFVPPRLANAETVNFADLQVQDLIGLDDAVQSIAHLGRRKGKLLAAREEAELEGLVSEALAAGDPLPARKRTNERNENRRSLRSIARRFDAELTKVEFLADYLDGQNPNGAFNRVLVRGATDAANKKEELVDRVLRPLVDLYTGMSKAQQRRMGEKVVVPELVTKDPETGVEGPTVFTRSDILAIALNTGNESNLSKMLRGESIGLSEANAWDAGKVQAVLDREMVEEDWQFVSSVWRQIDLLWPDIVRAEREITGIAPEKVEPRVVETKFGAIPGGYYPVVYDPARSAMAEANYEDDAAKLLGQMGRVVSTPKGHTITRTEAAAPLLLDLEGVLLNHVNRVTTRIAYGRFVRDALKFTNHPKVKDLVNRKFGPEYHRLFKSWLHRQVNDAAMDTVQLREVSYWLRKFRINTTMVGLGFRATTIAAQTSGLTLSAAEIGPAWLAAGMGEATANMGSVREFVFSRSPEMSTRAQSFDRDVRTFFTDMRGQRGKLDPIRSAAFWGIGNVQLFVVDVPTWLGAYRKAEHEGMLEDEAAAYADKVVRKTQSSGRPKDLSEIQDANEGFRVLTLFYSWFNVLYNKQRETMHSAKRGDWRRASANVAWIMMVAPLAAALLTGDWPEDEEAWTTWAARKVFFGLWLGIPGIRDVVGSVEREVAGKPTFATEAPFYRAFSEIKKPIRDLVDTLSGEGPSDRWLQNAIGAPGYFVGLPTGQPSATAQYLLDVWEGDQHPDDAGEFIAGLVKGPREEQLAPGDPQ